MVVQPNSPQLIPSSLGYTPGNPTDEKKINLLKLLLRHLPMKEYFQYFGMHEGEALYPRPGKEPWKGTAITVLEHRLKCENSQFFINEIDELARTNLMTNLQPYTDMAQTFGGSIRVGGNWENHVQECIHYFEPTENSLFLSDPSTMAQHVPVMGCMPYILGEGYDKRNLFMYIPEGIGAKFQADRFKGGKTTWTHQTLVARTLENLAELKRPCLHIEYKAGLKGEERSDHFIIVAPEEILSKVQHDYNLQRERKLIDTLREMEREDEPDCRLN